MTPHPCEKTTVNGYVLQRTQSRRKEELERWCMDKDRYHYGWITKVKVWVHPGEAPLEFWYCQVHLRRSWKSYVKSEVDTTRTGIVAKLAALVEGRTIPRDSFEDAEE